jgi:hypothetical protein
MIWIALFVEGSVPAVSADVVVLFLMVVTAYGVWLFFERD